MLSFPFLSTAPLLAGGYLLGSPAWSHPATLRQARVICTAGTSLTPTLLQLEIGGELISRRIPIVPVAPGEKIAFVTSLNLVVRAGEEVRCKCVRAPGTQDGAVRDLGVNLTAQVASSAPAPSEAFYVVYVNGQQQLRLFEYAPATHLFSESSPGISNGRATIVNGPDCLVTIDGVTALAIGFDRVLQCGRLTAMGGTSSGSASSRLEFWRGAQRLGSLTKSGQLVVADLSETDSVAGGLERFTFFGNGAPAAVLGPMVLTALAAREIG